MYARKVSVSMCDIQRDLLFFFLTIVFNLWCPLLSTFRMDPAGVQYIHFTGFSPEVFFMETFVKILALL